MAGAVHLGKAGHGQHALEGYPSTTNFSWSLFCNLIILKWIIWSCFQGDGPHYRHTTMDPDNQVKPLKQWDKSKLPCFYILSCSHRSDKAYTPSPLLLQVVRIYRFYCPIVFHFINQQLCIYFLSDSSKEIASIANCGKQHWPECSGPGLQEGTLAFMCSIWSVIVLHKNVTTLISGHETVFTSHRFRTFHFMCKSFWGFIFKLLLEKIFNYIILYVIGSWVSIIVLYVRLVRLCMF